MARLLLYVALLAAAFILYKVASLRLKAGASLENVSWRMFYAAILAEGIFKKHGANELVITSGADGKHSLLSKHYPENNASRLVEALDFRTWNVDKDIVAADLRRKLGPNYDVVIESTHIHVEYDPKGIA
jgi:hypothetical protein